MHLVSVIIPTHNRAALLHQAIESVLAVQGDNFALEVLVVDDGSTDDTPAVARAFPVTYLRTNGIGASGARNAGLHAATGDFIAFLDDDDLWLPNNISPQIRAFAEHPEYGAVYAQLWCTDADRKPYGDPMPAGPLTSGWIHDDLLTHWPQLGTLVVRASVARAIGDFDAALCSEEEWDWLLRIARRYPIGRVETPVMLFRQRGYEDDAVWWRRLPDTLKVFHRHTRDYAPVRRLRLQRILWKHRGWYAANFMLSARHYATNGKRAAALRCVAYAVRTSPPHAAISLARIWRAGATP